MANLILHDSTHQLVEQLKKQPPHALLLYSDQNVGLKTIASEIAGPTAQFVVPDEADTTTIKVDVVRRLYEQTRGKTATRRYFIIDNAETMTHSAQSAFLKLLEEPTDNIIFILTSHQPDQLLETIRSRVQQFRIAPPEPTKVAAFINRLESDPVEAKKLTFLANSSPSRAAYYARNPKEFRKDAEYMTSAREFLTATSRYTKLTIALSYAKQRTHVLQFLANCIRLQRLGAAQSAEHQRLADYLAIYDRLNSNANIKLALTQLVLK